MNEVAKQDKNYNPVSLGVTADVNQDITQMRTNAAGDALLVEVVGTGFVESVTGLDTDNTDPANPIVRISVDGTTVTGDGTPGDPLVAMASGGSVENGVTPFVAGNTNGILFQDSFGAISNFPQFAYDIATDSVTADSVSTGGDFTFINNSGGYEFDVLTPGYSGAAYVMNGQQFNFTLTNAPETSNFNLTTNYGVWQMSTTGVATNFELYSNAFGATSLTSGVARAGFTASGDDGTFIITTGTSTPGFSDKILFSNAITTYPDMHGENQFIQNTLSGSQGGSYKYNDNAVYAVDDKDYFIDCDTDAAGSMTVNLPDPALYIASTSGTTGNGRIIGIRRMSLTDGGDYVEIQDSTGALESPTGGGISYRFDRAGQTVWLMARNTPYYGYPTWAIIADNINWESIAAAIPAPGVTGSGATDAIPVWASSSALTFSNDYTMSFVNFKVTQTPIGTGISNANSWYEATRSINGAAQFNIRNSSSGTSASAGFIITQDNGTDAVSFTEIGRNSSTYNVAAQNFVGAGAGYILQDGSGDFGIATTAGAFRVAVGGTTTTQRKLEVSSQNVIWTNNGYVGTWTNTTNSTWWSDSVANSAASRTVNLRSESTTYTGATAHGTAWYMRDNIFTFTPSGNVTTGSWRSVRDSTTYTIGSRTVALTDIVNNTVASSIVNTTNGGNLTITGSIVNQLLTQAYSVGGTAVEGQMNFINQYIANTGAMPSGLFKGISLYVSSIPGTAPFFPGSIPNDSQWGVVVDAQRNWFKSLMIGDANPTLEGSQLRAAMRLTTAQSYASTTTTAATYTYGVYTNNVLYCNATSNNQVITLVGAGNPNTIEDGLRCPVMKIDATANTVTVQVDGVTNYIWGPTIVGKVATVVLSTAYAGGTFMKMTHIDGTHGWLYLPGVI